MVRLEKDTEHGGICCFVVKTIFCGSEIVIKKAGNAVISYNVISGYILSDGKVVEVNSRHET